MNLKENIIRVFFTNFLAMISGIIIGFVIPAVLSVQSYSNLKTYIFYVSYIGILHFGFIDGMYIKYGGKSIDEINKGEFKLEHRIFIIMQLIATIIFIALAFILKDFIVFLMAVSIIPINTFSFYQLFYQAVGEFKKYANVSYTYTIIYLGINILLALVFKSGNYILYCFAPIIADIVALVYLEINYFKLFHNVKTSYNKNVWNNIRVGFFILLGNLSVTLFYGLDRWFIKIFYSTNDFAYYSFAISMLNLITTLFGAISITFYNYISKGEDEKSIKKLKKYLIILGTFASLGFFAFAGIIHIFLKKYLPALDIISISFVAYPYMVVINSLFVNLYKARKKEKKYLKVVVIMLVISCIYNGVAMMISKNPSSIAFATTASFITWYIYSVKDFNYLKPTKNEVKYLITNFILFLILAHYFNWIIGGIIYLIVIILTLTIFLRDEMQELLKYVLKKLNYDSVIKK